MILTPRCKFGCKDIQGLHDLIKPCGTYHRRIVHARERRGVGEVVVVGMRDEDQVDLAQRFELFVLLWCFWIVDEIGVKHDHVSVRRNQAERRLAKPQQMRLAVGRFGHRCYCDQ